MAYQVRLLVLKTDNLSSVPRTYAVGGETDSYKWSCDVHVWHNVCIYILHPTQIRINKCMWKVFLKLFIGAAEMAGGVLRALQSTL